MEQLRHRLTNVSAQGQRRSVDQNILKRSALDDFVNCYFGGKHGDTAPRLQGSRHDRKESERFKSFTYEELTKRDKSNLDIFWLKDAQSRRGQRPRPTVLAGCRLASSA